MSIRKIRSFASDVVQNRAAIDSSGCIYVAGNSQGDLGGTGHAGKTDMVLIKFTSSGETVWTRQLGTETHDTATGVVIDKDDNIYVAGSSYGDFDGHTNAGTTDYHDVFLIKYTTSGDKVWSRLFGSAVNDRAYDMALDNEGNIYITGGTYGSLDGNTHQGGWDMFLLKYNSSGDRLLTKQLGSTAHDEGTAVAVDSKGNILVTGYSKGDFEGNTHGGGGGNDMFLAMISPDGISEEKMWGISGSVSSSGITVDYDDNIYITGYTSAVMNIAAGDSNTFGGIPDIFLMKIDGNKNVEWTKMMGSSNEDYAFDAAVSSNNDIFVTGYTNDSLNGSHDMFLLKYDSSGSVRSIRQYGSTEDDLAGGIIIDDNDNIYVTGYTAGGLGENTSAGDNDIFLVKFDLTGEMQ
ncbi:MAG: hypothetical protein GY754_21590 [bacterium]|nr:hypothetical protein [bacterium]